MLKKKKKDRYLNVAVCLCPLCACRKQRELEEAEKEKRREEKLRKREQKLKEREEKKNQKKVKKQQEEEQKKLHQKIALEERKLLLVQRNLESIRLIAELLSRAKVTLQTLYTSIVIFSFLSLVYSTSRRYRDRKCVRANRSILLYNGKMNCYYRNNSI